MFAFYLIKNKAYKWWNLSKCASKCQAHTNKCKQLHCCDYLHLD